MAKLVVSIVGKKKPDWTSTKSEQEPIKLKQTSDSRESDADGFQVGDGSLAGIVGRAPIQCGDDGLGDGGGHAAAVVHGASRSIDRLGLSAVD